MQDLYKTFNKITTSNAVLLNEDDVKQVILEQTKQLRDTIAVLQKKVEDYSGESRVYEYKDEEVDDTIIDISGTSIVDSMPVLRGKQVTYHGDTQRNQTT